MPIHQFEEWPELVNYENECVNNAKKMIQALEVLNRHRAKKIKPEESAEIKAALEQTQDWYLLAVKALKQADGKEKKLAKLWKGLERIFPTPLSGDRNNFSEMKKIVVRLAEVYEAMLEIDNQARWQKIDIGEEIVGFDLKKEYEKDFLISRRQTGKFGNVVIAVDGRMDAETPKIYLPRSEVRVNVIDADLNRYRHSFSSSADFDGSKFCVRIEDKAFDNKDHLNSAVYKEIISQGQGLIAP